MISLNFYNGEILISSSYDYKDRIKELSYRKWDPNLKVWKTTVNNLNEVLEKFPEASLSDGLVEFINHKTMTTEKSRATFSSGKVELGDFGKGKKLLPFQKAGLEFIDLTYGRAIVADDMGLGKTIQTLAYLQTYPDIRPVIIVCPASVKFNWRNEINQWLTTEENIEVISKGKPDISKASIIIINYDILGKWLDDLKAINPEIIIFDESHMLKNSKAARTKAAKKLASEIDHVIALTGTPILNKPIELFSQLNIVNPKAYPANKYFSFAVKYCNGHQNNFGWDFSGSSNLEELSEELKGFMIRRTKEQVLSELPSKRRTKILLPMSNRKEYDLAFAEFKAWRAAEEKPYERDVLVWLETLKKHCTEGKLTAAKEWVKDFLETENKLVLFGTHRMTIDFFMNEFKGCAVKIDGSTSQKEREQAVYRFQNDEKIKLFVGNIKAAGMGITLTAASNVAFVELDWTPALHEQAEDRCNRIGQKTAVNSYYLLSEKTLDENILVMLENKKNIIEEVMADDKILSFELI